MGLRTALFSAIITTWQTASTHPLHRILDAVFYVLRTGCAWCYLPANFPPWQTVCYPFGRFRLQGTWHLLYTALHRAERERGGQHPDPSAAIMYSRDSQNVKAVEESARIRGYDAHHSRELADWCKQQGGWELEIVARAPGTHGFQVQPGRWVVEYSFAWLSRNRRLARDHERKVQASEAFIEDAATRLVLRRLAPGT